MKKLTIEIVEDEKGELETKLSSEGFNYLELRGLQAHLNDIYQDLLDVEEEQE